MISVKALMILSRDKILGKQPENMRAVDIGGTKLPHFGDQHTEPRVRRRRAVPERTACERVKEGGRLLARHLVTRQQHAPEPELVARAEAVQDVRGKLRGGAAVVGRTLREYFGRGAGIAVRFLQREGK